ncbi:WD40-repeat-containing domain protein [Schizophyllum commune]
MHRPSNFRWPLVDGYQVAQLSDDMGRPIPIERIAIGASGKFVAALTPDNRIRVCTTSTRKELSKLGHSKPVTDFGFLDPSEAIYALHEDGHVKWEKKQGSDRWKRAVIHGTAFGQQPASAVWQGRVAISERNGNVRFWVLKKYNGRWHEPQKLFNQPRITVMKFAENGETLVGGTADGLLWHFGMASGTLRTLHIFEQAITSIDIDQETGRVLVSLANGHAVLYDLRPGATGVERVYAPEGRPAASSFGALFAAGGKAVVHGTARGCALVWDTAKAQVVYGMNNSEDDPITCAAAFEGDGEKPGFIVTGSKGGQLVWWAQPSCEWFARAGFCGNLLTGVQLQSDERGEDRKASTWCNMACMLFLRFICAFLYCIHMQLLGGFDRVYAYD